MEPGERIAEYIHMLTVMTKKQAKKRGLGIGSERRPCRNGDTMIWR